MAPDLTRTRPSSEEGRQALIQLHMSMDDAPTYSRSEGQTLSSRISQERGLLQELGIETHSKLPYLTTYEGYFG